MEQYDFKIRYQKADTQRSVVIKADALSDDEAIRIAHPIADLIEFEGGSAIEIAIGGPNSREIAIISDARDEQQGNYLERSHLLGGGYRRIS